MTDPAVLYLFHVKIDLTDIGMWTECTGLSAKYEIEEYQEGGQNLFVHKLPGRLKFDNVKLKRPMDDGSGKVATWFASVHASSLVRSTASIMAYDANLTQVASWNLIDVIPVSWTGPSLNATSNSVASEELELAHHGFM